MNIETLGYFYPTRMKKSKKNIDSIEENKYKKGEMLFTDTSFYQH